MPAATLVSVNAGLAQFVPTGRRVVRTAILKASVEGPVRLGPEGLTGDQQADRRVHGGPDKAVYAYAIEDTRAWEAELGRGLGPAAFGENLTTEGLDVSGARVGERWAIGTAVLEVVQPRLPCFKLGLRMGDAAFVRRFAQASRPGAYLRVVVEGELRAGDAIEVVERPEHEVDMRLMSDAILLDHTRLPEVLAAPGLIEDWRRWVAERGAA